MIGKLIEGNHFRDSKLEEYERIFSKQQSLIDSDRFSQLSTNIKKTLLANHTFS